MILTKTEIEKNEYFIFDDCEFQRSQEINIVNNQKNISHYWTYKLKPSEIKNGASYTNWNYCTKEESIDMENKYKDLKNE